MTKWPPHTLGLLVCLFESHCHLVGHVSSHLTLEVLIELVGPTSAVLVPPF